MKPLHYFAKLIRLKGLENGDEEIFEVLMERNILTEHDEEELGVYRQVCRLNCSGLKSYQMDNVVKRYIDILKEVDLLGFRDKKGNNFLHLMIKGIKKEERFDIKEILFFLNKFKEGQ